MAVNHDRREYLAGEKTHNVFRPKRPGIAGLFALLMSEEDYVGEHGLSSWVGDRVVIAPDTGDTWEMIHGFMAGIERYTNITERVKAVAVDVFGDTA